MSVESVGSIGASAAGSQRARIAGSEVERSKLDATRQRPVAAEQPADTAAGIAATDGQDLQADERDADGRRAWERGANRPKNPADGELPPIVPGTGQDGGDACGNQLDVTG